MANDLNHVKVELYLLFNSASDEAQKHNFDAKSREAYLKQVLDTADKIVVIERAIKDGTAAMGSM